MKHIDINSIESFEGLLLDVRLSDDFDAAHLPGATNNCVFEMVFGERMDKVLPDRSKPICVYGASAGSREAEMAAEKLQRSGYRDVAVFEGGVEAWRDSGRTLEAAESGGDGGPLAGVPQPPNGRRAVDLDESRLLWVGRNLLNRHWGTVAISHGWVEIENDALAGGEFTIDMNAIECSDLDEDSGSSMLIAHLQSDDFFDTERFPEAKFCIRSAERIIDAADGAPNLRIDGDLSLKDRTLPVTFEAVAGVTADGRTAAQATLAIDRTQWNVIYGSGKFFHRLAGHLVNDLIELQIKIVA